MNDGRIDGRPALPTVMVVEDETLVRMAIVQELAEGGYPVIEAASAAEAIDVLEAGYDVGVVFTDVRMPGDIDGVELARVIAERFPSVSVILTSAHTCGIPPEMRDGIVFLPKPYSSPVVLELVSNRIRALEERHGSGAA